MGGTFWGVEGGRRTSGNEISDLNGSISCVSHQRLSGPLGLWQCVSRARASVSAGHDKRRKALEAQLSAKLEGMRDQTGT